MAEFRNTNGCDLCGQDQCNCPPCPCKWCKYDRGEATTFERAQVEAHIAAIKAADDRKYARESAAKMAENIARLSAPEATP